MRRRMAISMIALFLIAFPLGAYLITSACFNESMARERERALSEEAAIARALAMELSGKTAAEMYTVAGAAQKKYGSSGLEIILLYQSRPMAGKALPEVSGIDELIAHSSRATLLCAQTQKLYISHRLNGAITLFLASDVSPVYALYEKLMLFSGFICLAGVFLTCGLAVLISGILSRPLKKLSNAAVKIQAGDYNTPLPKIKKDEVGALTRAFSAMAQAVSLREEKLKTEAAGRQELIDALAHEMRTPLTAILSGARLIETASLTGEENARVMETIASEAGRLSRMDETLLKITSLESEKPVFAACAFSEIAGEAAGIFENVVVSGEDVFYFCDRELLIALIRNLIVNARRAGGERPIELTYNKEGFFVKDYGCGMTRDEIARAFEPFYKADPSRTRKEGGAGLGLTLCLKIAKLHGATMEILSEKGVGTTVIYHFDTTKVNTLKHGL